MNKKLILFLALCMLVNFNTPVKASNVITNIATNEIKDKISDIASDLIKGAADNAVDAAKDKIDETIEGSEISSEVNKIKEEYEKYKNRTWFQKIIDWIKNFFKSLFGFSQTNSEISDIVNTIKEVAVEESNNNLDETTSSIISNILTNKEVTDEETESNTNEILDIIKDVAGIVTSDSSNTSSSSNTDDNLNVNINFGNINIEDQADTINAAKSIISEFLK